LIPCRFFPFPSFNAREYFEGHFEESVPVFVQRASQYVEFNFSFAATDIATSIGSGDLAYTRVWHHISLQF
jgi:hypothetical protein